jgi:winged helix DNA-binding protein
VTLSWSQVLAWRLRLQFLQSPSDGDVAAVVSRVCGVQAQVPSAAELAIALRREQGRCGEVANALAERRVFRTWAMRGTLHVLPLKFGAACLALIAAARDVGEGHLAAGVRNDGAARSGRAGRARRS